MNFTEPLILSLLTKGLILSWVTQVRGDVVILRLSHIQEAWTVFFPKRCLLPESPGIFLIWEAPHTPPSILGTFPSEGVFSNEKTRDNYLCYLFLTHIPVLSCCCTIHLKPMETEVCALGFCFSGQMVSAAVVSAAVLWVLWWWQSPHCPLFLQLWMGMNLQHLSCFLPLPLAVLCSFSEYCWHSWFGFTLTWCSREAQESFAPIPHPSASHWWGRTQLTVQELQQPNRENWFLQPMQAASGCPYTSSTAGDNTAPWMTLAGWKLGVKNRQTTQSKCISQQIVPGIRGVDGAAMLLYPDLSSLNST